MNTKIIAYLLAAIGCCYLTFLLGKHLRIAGPLKETNSDKAVTSIQEGKKPNDSVITKDKVHLPDEGSAPKKGRESVKNELRVPPTPLEIKNSLKNADNLVLKGDYKAALAEYLWLYNEGMMQVRGFSGVRASFLLSKMVELGDIYPDAKKVLEYIRDENYKRILADSEDTSSLKDYLNINSAKGENGRNIDLLHKLLPDDPRKRVIVGLTSNALREERLYSEIVEFRDVSRALGEIALLQSQRPNFEESNNKNMTEASWNNTVARMMSNDVEIFAGAGKVDDAILLANRLLAYNRSDNTKALLIKALRRSGRIDLQARIEGLN